MPYIIAYQTPGSPRIIADVVHNFSAACREAFRIRHDLPAIHIEDEVLSIKPILHIKNTSNGCSTYIIPSQES